MEEYVTLEEMLRFREEKVRRQEALKTRHERNAIVTFGMNIPGSIKTSPDIFKAFNAGTAALEQAFTDEGIPVTEKEMVKEKEGYLSFYALYSTDPFKVKTTTVGLEDTHPLGRLFDIDVYDEDGKGVSRELLGFSARKCLLCSQDAKLCARNRSHTVKELYDQVEKIIKTWSQSSFLNKF